MVSYWFPLGFLMFPVEFQLKQHSNSRDLWDLTSCPHLSRCTMLHHVAPVGPNNIEQLPRYPGKSWTHRWSMGPLERLKGQPDCTVGSMSQWILSASMGISEKRHEQFWKAMKAMWRLRKVGHKNDWVILGPLGTVKVLVLVLPRMNRCEA